jgi:putative oxidoreductase
VQLNKNLAMDITNKIEKQNSGKLPFWLSFVRIGLGLTLFWKGILFIQDLSGLESMLHGTMLNMPGKGVKIIAYIIPYMNLLGGLFISVGLFTRWAALIQIPILIGAVFFINVATGISINNSELILSVVVLILLVVFVIKGSGYLSADEYFRSYYKAGTESGNLKNFFS